MFSFAKALLASAFLSASPLARAANCSGKIRVNETTARRLTTSRVDCHVPVLIDSSHCGFEYTPQYFVRDNSWFYDCTYVVNPTPTSFEVFCVFDESFLFDFFDPWIGAARKLDDSQGNSSIEERRLSFGFGLEFYDDNTVVEWDAVPPAFLEECNDTINNLTQENQDLRDIIENLRTTETITQTSPTTHSSTKTSTTTSFSSTATTGTQTTDTFTTSTETTMTATTATSTDTTSSVSSTTFTSSTETSTRTATTRTVTSATATTITVTTATATSGTATSGTASSGTATTGSATTVTVFDGESRSWTSRSSTTRTSDSRTSDTRTSDTRTTLSRTTFLAPTLTMTQTTTTVTTSVTTSSSTSEVFLSLGVNQAGTSTNSDSLLLFLALSLALNVLLILIIIYLLLRNRRKRVVETKEVAKDTESIIEFELDATFSSQHLSRSTHHVSFASEAISNAASDDKDARGPHGSGVAGAGDSWSGRSIIYRYLKHGTRSGNNIQATFRKGPIMSAREPPQLDDGHTDSPTPSRTARTPISSQGTRRVSFASEGAVSGDPVGAAGIRSAGPTAGPAGSRPSAPSDSPAGRSSPPPPPKLAVQLPPAALQAAVVEAARRAGPHADAGPPSRTVPAGR